MKRTLSFEVIIKHVLLLVLLACLILLSEGVLLAEDQNGNLRVGTARVNITPATPIPMSGYGARDGPFRGIHDSLYTRVIVFDDGARKAAVISADVIGFSHEFWRRITRKIQVETSIDSHYVLLTATHNHGGPVTRVYSETNSPDVLAYTEELEQNLLDAVKYALADLQPARIGTGSGICKMNMNRRARTADGGITLGKNPYGPTDHTVGVIKIENAQKTPFAFLINWPCHGTVMGGRNYQITGDWPGAAARYVESSLGTNPVAAITAGASGDIDPIYRVLPEFGSRGEAEVTGIILGEEVVRIARQIETYPYGTLRSLQRVITLPGKQRGDSYQPQETYEPGPDVSVRLTTLKIGPVVLVGISGEVMTDIGLQIKEQSPYKSTVVITHCNGSSGYLVTDETYEQGGYEAMATRVMAGAERSIISHVLDMIYSL